MRHVSGLLIGKGSAVVIGRCRLEVFQLDERSVIGILFHGKRTDRRKVAETRILAVLEKHLTLWFSAKPNHGSVRRHISGHVTQG